MKTAIDPLLRDQSKYKKKGKTESQAKNIPRLRESYLQPPDELSEAAKKEWGRVVNLYGKIEIPIITDLDTELLKSHCIYVEARNKLYAEYKKLNGVYAEKEQKTRAKTKSDKAETDRISATKEVIITPILRELRQIEQRLTAVDEQLCLTPIGRVKLGIAREKGEGEELDEFSKLILSAKKS